MSEISEEEVKEWWGKVNSCAPWSGGISGHSWAHFDDWDDMKEQLYKIYAIAIKTRQVNDGKEN